jgi:hypothetical protein
MIDPVITPKIREILDRLLTEGVALKIIKGQRQA